MTKQIAKMNVNGVIYTITNDSTKKINPLRVYKTTAVFDQYGRFQRRSRKTLDKYGDFNSCLICILSDINGQEMTILPFETLNRIWNCEGGI